MNKFIIEIELSGLIEIEAISANDALEKANILSIDKIRDELLNYKVTLIESYNN